MDEKLTDMILEWKRTKSVTLATDICNYLAELLDEIANT